MLDKKTIINFGFPNTLKDLDLKFCFNDSLANDFVGCGCYCNFSGTKFFIYNLFASQPIFTMDFYIAKDFKNPFSTLRISERRVHLQHIATHHSYRKQGIASYYINKLIEFCINNDIHLITLDVCPDSNDTLNALNANDLNKFYNHFSSDKVKIQII
ncbi:MAG: GNAT family N-acetyltransferase [Clostridiales bacterium]|nr:GNAT family N-acetyltransferase [Clostridiales bacterium]